MSGSTKERASRAEEMRTARAEARELGLCTLCMKRDVGRGRRCSVCREKVRAAGRRRIGAVREHRCSECGEPGHYVTTCPSRAA